MRYLATLALVFLVTGCGGDNPDVADPDDLSLEIVSGDGQAAPVRIDEGAAASVAAYSGPSLQTSPPPNTFPDPLVARLVDAGGSTSSTLAGPSAALVPEGVVVNYHTIQPDEATTDRRCGDPWNGSDIPDDSGYVADWMERGTLAADCPVEARAIIENDAGEPEPIVVDTFVVTTTPGPVAQTPFVDFEGYDNTPLGFRSSRDSLVHLYQHEYGQDGRYLFQDVHGNPVEFDVAATGWLTAVQIEVDGDSIWALQRSASSIEGDTATVRFHNGDGELLAEAAAELDRVWSDDQWDLILTTRESVIVR